MSKQQFLTKHSSSEDRNLYPLPMSVDIRRRCDYDIRVYQ
jgi:hypothetical protein